MKKILSVLISVVAVMCAACDSYIDITPKGTITVESAYTYYELVATPMRCYYPSHFILLSDNQWAKESNIIGYESQTMDGINFTFNESADRTLIADNNLYENIYSYILRSNLIISNINDAEGSDEIRKLGMAEARVLRAFDHFLAVNVFAKAYDPSTAGTDGGICIVDFYDLESTPKKSTVADVYDFIIKELEESVPLLQEEALNIYHPNRAFGYALLAKVYLFHRDWEKARQAADMSLAQNSTLVDYNMINDNGGIARYRNYANENNPEVLSYMWMGSGWSAEQATFYRYGVISPELVNLFEANDLRYSLFFRQTGTTVTNYFDIGSGAAIWTPATTTARFTYMSVGLRTAEVYLMLAEAYARQNNLAAATNYVNLLRSKRLSGSSTDIDVPKTQKEMMLKIIDERRKELQFGFNRFFDLKRFNLESDYRKTVTRRFPVVTKDKETKTYTLAPDSRLYIIPFPKSARDKNPNLTLNTDEK